MVSKRKRLDELLLKIEANRMTNIGGQCSKAIKEHGKGKSEMMRCSSVTLELSMVGDPGPSRACQAE